MCHPWHKETEPVKLLSLSSEGCALSLPLRPLSPLPPHQLNKRKPAMVQYQLFVFVSLMNLVLISFGLQLANELAQRSPVPNIRPH